MSGCSTHRSTRKEMNPGLAAMIALARSMVSMNSAARPGSTGSTACSVTVVIA